MGTKLGADARAIGGACGRNPIPIVIPCHRVVGGGGRPDRVQRRSRRRQQGPVLAHEGALLL
jgi:methylated-DNA-[protein]-cysteine S-methyltransferase